MLPAANKFGIVNRPPRLLWTRRHALAAAAGRRNSSPLPLRTSRRDPERVA